MDNIRLGGAALLCTLKICGQPEPRVPSSISEMRLTISSATSLLMSPRASGHDLDTTTCGKELSRAQPSKLPTVCIVELTADFA